MRRLWVVWQASMRGVGGVRGCVRPCGHACAQTRMLAAAAAAYYRCQRLRLPPHRPRTHVHALNAQHAVDAVRSAAIPSAPGGLALANHHVVVVLDLSLPVREDVVGDELPDGGHAAPLGALLLEPVVLRGGGAGGGGGVAAAPSSLLGREGSSSRGSRCSRQVWWAAACGAGAAGSSCQRLGHGHAARAARTSSSSSCAMSASSASI